jgi:HK97 family phage major capsid protein/HK97 family phage prohead protease
MPPERPPKDNIVRAIYPGYEIRDATDDGAIGILAGHFSVFGAWYEVNSAWEGHFLERVDPGSFKKTFTENRSEMRVTFNHGQDPQLGDKILGPISVLEEDGTGARYEVPLMDTSYNRDLLPGLKLKQNGYGASFRFRVVKDEFDKRARVSDYNPDGLPERTIKEVQVMEFGPVTYPASASATAGVRSLTDQYVRNRLGSERAPLPPEEYPWPSDAEVADHLAESPPAGHGMSGPLGDAKSQHEVMHAQGSPLHHIHPANALQETGAGRAHSEDGSRDPDPPPDAAPSKNQDPPDGGSSDSRSVSVPPDIKEYRTRDEMYTRETELKNQLNSLAVEFPGTMPTERQAEFDDKGEELVALRKVIKVAEERAKFIEDNATNPDHVERTDVTPQPTWQAPTGRNQNRTDDVVVRDIYDFAEIRNRSRNPEHEVELLRSSALRAIDGAELVHTPYANRAKCGDALDEIIRSDESGEASRRILSTGSPAYRRFFHKTLLGGVPTVDEQRAAALTGLGATTTTGGFATVYELDPTIMPTSNGTVNPYRSISKVVKTTANEWRAVTSTGTTAVMAGEATAVVEGGPTLAQPAAIVQKAHGEVTFSIEAGEDIANLDNQLGAMFVDAKDILECQKFTTGAGTTIFPQGILIGAAASTTATATTTVIAAADLYAIEAALAPRFRTNATWVMNRFITNKVRGIDTAGGAQLYTPNLTVGLTNYNGAAGPVQYNLLGYPVAECSEMPASVATTVLEAVFGDFGRYFAIIDKIGMNVELVPLFLDPSTGFPTGQRALYFYWRFTSKVLSASAFQIMKGA